ncbi:MAG: stage II sporulation protein M, partial [Clostridiales bacterium]
MGRFWLAYLIFFLIFAIGLFCGYLAPSFLDSSQIGDLHNYLDQSLKALPNADLQIAKESKNAFFFNGGILFFLFLSGMTVFGLFLLVPALFYKGFTMGFSIGLMFGHKVAEGMVITVLTILPQALLIVPLIMAGALYSSLF